MIAQLLLFLAFCTFEASGQVLKQFKKINALKKDSTVNIHYFKNVDSVILNKLDSFDQYLTKRKFQLDSNFFYNIEFTPKEKKLSLHLSYNFLYSIYLVMLSKENKIKISQPFAFFFYKNRLVICTTFSEKLIENQPAQDLLANLMYEHLSIKEKKMIDAASKDVEVYCCISRTYLLDW
jgi:hypothetical protein